ncbi:MAG: hypothetical protein ABL962_17700 [Fimbriimonadaceae bacterium]
MAIDNFQGQTFIAYADIAGFKGMMSDGNRGPAALDALYQSGYQVISHQPAGSPRVEGLFVSDCGILFVRGNGPPAQRLEALLAAIESLNRRCFDHAVFLTTAIAWGEFSYHDRIEIPGIEKNPIYGNAYVAAFLDNEAAIPKLYPTDCRILKRDLLPDVVDLCTQRQGSIWSRMRNAQNHFYFDWMRPA